ncbi:MAG: sporulation protein YabP [Oscillospiraceae bacterium]
MQEQKDIVKFPHNIIMEDRKVLSVSGVEDIQSFDDNQVILLTQMGEMQIKGTNLHINKLNVETGELSMDGTIFAIIYNEQPNQSHKKQSFFKKIMR